MKKVPLHRIGVQRQGVTVYPEIGKPFDFTAEELTSLDKLSGETKIDYYRSPVNETGATPSAPVVDEGAGDTHAKVIAIVRELLADNGNLNDDGNLKMDVLTAAMKAAGLPKMSAAQRDAVVAEIDNL